MNHPCKHPEVIGLPEGRYANYFQVGYSVLFDFGQFYAESGETQLLHTRIVTNPVYAKARLKALHESIFSTNKPLGLPLRKRGKGNNTESANHG